MNGKTMRKPPQLFKFFLHFESGRWQSRQPEQYIQLEAINSDVPIVDILIDPLIGRNIPQKGYGGSTEIQRPVIFSPDTFGLTN